MKHVLLLLQKQAHQQIPSFFKIYFKIFIRQTFIVGKPAKFQTCKSFFSTCCCHTVIERDLYGHHSNKNVQKSVFSFILSKLVIRLLKLLVERKQHENGL